MDFSLIWTILAGTNVVHISGIKSIYITLSFCLGCETDEDCLKNPSPSFGLVHLFAKNLSMMSSWGDFYRKLPDTFSGLQRRLETRGNPFSSYTPQQYGSVSRTSVSSGCTYSEGDGGGREAIQKKQNLASGLA